MTQTNKKATAKAGKGRPTPKNKQTKAAANRAASRKAANQWYAMIAVAVLFVVAAVVLYSVFGDAQPINYENNLRTGQ